MPAPCPYGVCDGDGFVVEEATNTARPCECRAARLAGRRARGLEGRMRQSHPRRFRDLSFERHPLSEIAQLQPGAARAARRYAAELDDRLDRGDGLWLYGTKGTGKTTLAYYVSQHAAALGRSVLVWNTIDLLNDLRRSFDDGAPVDTTEIVDAACSVDLLQLEDLSAARTTEWVLEQLYLIVNRRYEEERAIVFTSDLAADAPPDPTALADRIGERTFSRLVQMCGDPVVMTGADMRLSA